MAFDIAQFFSFLNHLLFFHIIRKAGFDPKVAFFFSNYLVERKTQYFWNNFSFSFFNVDIGVGQGSALSSILSVLYLAPILYILEKCLKILKISVSILLFEDDSLLVAQSKLLSFLNNFLFCSYYITSSLLEQFSLIIEHGKMVVFHFSRSHGIFDPSLLDLTPPEGFILHLKNIWKYLGFIFNRKLFFQQHIDFYVNKAISTIKYMNILGNSICGLVPHQK